MATAVAVVGLAFSVSESRKAKKAQKKASKIQSKKAALENARQRRAQVAQARRQRAAAVAQAEASGISGGSQISGVASSIQTQAASNVSFLNQLEGFDQARFGALSDASDAQGRAATFQAISNVPSQLGLIKK